MRIRVEFFGIPRQRAGRADIELVLTDSESSQTLGDVFRTLAEELPDFARDCLDGNHLKPGYIANINGQRFVSDPETIIAEGETLLILSADAGG